MRRFLLIGFAFVSLAAAGFAAYSLGRSLRPPVELSATRLANPVDVSHVSLTNHLGASVSMAELSKKVTLIFFGYTRCPDVCPLTMNRLANVYRDLGEPQNLQVIMVTVDPQDSPEATHSYASAFHSNFIGLSGSNTELATALQTFYIGAVSDGTGLITHTDALIVLDDKAQMRLIYGQSNMRGLSEELAAVLAQRNW